MRGLALIVMALVIVGCDFQQERGSWDPIQDPTAQRTGAEPSPDDVESDDSTEDAAEEFVLMSSYSDDDLDAISSFVEWNIAVDALKQSIAEHPQQRIKTAPLYGGIAMFTSVGSAYWWKEEVLYAANGYARAYSPELPKAPEEITHNAIQQAVREYDRRRRLGDGEVEVSRADLIDAAFGEFIALVNYANSKIEGADYSTAFLDEVEVPVSQEALIVTVGKFNQLLNQIGQEHSQLYAGLKIDQSQLLYTYGKISTGMTMDQVTNLLGTEGAEMDRMATSTGEYTLHVWKNFAGSNVYVFLRDGIVHDKVVLGLI